MRSSFRSEVLRRSSTADIKRARLYPPTLPVLEERSLPVDLYQPSEADFDLLGCSDTAEVAHMIAMQQTQSLIPITGVTNVIVLFRTL